jgi:molybdenum cofactor biosynthesis enzyme MoaA
VKLEEIGFYTLSDNRARVADHTTPLYRCELLLTDRCNFNCPYCRKQGGPDVEFKEALSIVEAWAAEGLKNVRFSGGEPTLWKYLEQLVFCTRMMRVERIALSTNGSASRKKYEALIRAGVNDFSISLDACCADTANKMSGGRAVYQNILDNIKYCASQVYTTVGVVITDDNLDEIPRLVRIANDELGVSDIRLISAAQWNKPLDIPVDDDILRKMPILRYRVHNMKIGRYVRGIGPNDNHSCPLVLDDMAVMQGKHYPCIIHLREGGNAIGKVGPNMREERRRWHEEHNCYKDPICQKNCLDVCIHFNNRSLQLKTSEMQRCKEG